MDGTFNPTYSTNDIWRDQEMTQCLTLDLEAIEADIAALEVGKADNDHTHTGYAPTAHTHSEYAVTNHEHTGYANAEHTHTGFAEASHSHSEYAAVSHEHDGYADADHTHTGFAPETHAHSEYALTEHEHTGYASSTHAHASYAHVEHTHTGYAATAHTHSEYAPAGYGLGANRPETVYNLDTALTTGWYVFDDTTVNKPTDLNYGVVTVVGRNEMQAFQFVEDVIKGVRVRRVRNNSIWGEWEYENPLMVPGTEYRTTEHYNGKPVYTKLINFGQLPNNTTIAVATGVQANNIIYVDGVTYNNNEMVPFPCGNSGTLGAYCYFNGTNISVRSMNDLSGYTTTYFIIKYIKE